MQTGIELAARHGTATGPIRARSGRLFGEPSCRAGALGLCTWLQQLSCDRFFAASSLPFLAAPNIVLLESKRVASGLPFPATYARVPAL